MCLSQLHHIGEKLADVTTKRHVGDDPLHGILLLFFVLTVEIGLELGSLAAFVTTEELGTTT